MTTLLSAVGITAASAITVAMFTLRVALATRGRRLFAAGIAGFEAILFALVLTGLVTNLGDPVRLGAYAVGVASGTMLGLFVDARLNAGQSEVRLIVPGDGGILLRRLHTAGWPATATAAVGLSGRATSVTITVDERRVPEVLATIEGADPAPFVSVAQLRQARPVRLPAGFVQVSGGRSRPDRPSRDLVPSWPSTVATSLAAPTLLLEDTEPAPADHDGAALDAGHEAAAPDAGQDAASGNDAVAEHDAVAGHDAVARRRSRDAHPAGRGPNVDRPEDPSIAIRDLRLASAELGEAMVAVEPDGAVAFAIATWLGDVAQRLGRDLAALPPNAVLLARAHGVLARSLAGVTEVADAPALAARARGLADVLRSGLPHRPGGRAS